MVTSFLNSPLKNQTKLWPKHQKYHCKIMKNIKSLLQVHFWWYILFCSHMCKDINDKNTKPKKLISKARLMFWNTQKKCLKNIWKLGNWIKNMVKLVLQHKQIDNVKSSNVKELHYFLNKYQNHHLNSTKTWNQVSWCLLMIQNVLLHMISVTGYMTLISTLFFS